MAVPDKYNSAYHDTAGNTTWGSPYHILTPILQFMYPTLPLYMFYSYLMLNVHGGAPNVLNHAMEAVLDCVQRLTVEGRLTSFIGQCGVFTANSPHNQDETREYVLPQEFPHAYIIHPIFPFNNKTSLVGFMGALFQWSDIIATSSLDRELYYVIKNDYETITYRTKSSLVTYLGRGDLHDEKYSKYGVTLDLTKEVSEASFPE
jgi:hypothetical protein